MILKFICNSHAIIIRHQSCLKDGFSVFHGCAAVSTVWLQDVEFLSALAITFCWAIKSMATWASSRVLLTLLIFASLSRDLRRKVPISPDFYLQMEFCCYCGQNGFQVGEIGIKNPHESMDRERITGPPQESQCTSNANRRLFQGVCLCFCSSQCFSSSVTIREEWWEVFCPQDSRPWSAFLSVYAPSVNAQHFREMPLRGTSSHTGWALPAHHPAVGMPARGTEGSLDSGSLIITGLHRIPLPTSVHS